ncbi:hypothetical protein D5S18_06805 [Nocardia panacis]|uniref:Uncharacterized protein n=1 Tax=Nocardia panacis TaxID=2340916 RepID=A0A3A4KM49_9NOCA|nr:hypothetical protein D5S18_06805 [Nocardia panacis]
MRRSSSDSSSGSEVGAVTTSDRARSDTRAGIAEQFAKYRAEAGRSAAYDECGRPTEGFYDELVGTDGRVRRMWSELSADFVEIGVDGLGRLDGRVRRLIEDDGITYTAVGDEPAPPVPWRLDPIPLLVSADDWTRLEAGLVQRSRVLDEVLTDIYGPRRTLTSGLLPPEVVFGHHGYVRAAHGITIPGRHQLFLHACDISRWSDGRFHVSADWAQAPSGAGYALADRRVVSTAIPEAFEHSNPRPLTPFARAMRLMLIESAPRADDADPVVVVLSPGVHSETAFDQAYLASRLGFPLVESADLVVRDGALWMRSLGTLERVDVVLRRVDAEFSDPLDLRPDSRLGVVGLVEVLRRGAVTVVNTLGSGLLENPALAVFLPELSRALLSEDLELANAPTYWGGRDAERNHLRVRLNELIIRSAVDGRTIYGPGLTTEQCEQLRARVEDRGWEWVGQEPAQFSVAPAVRGPGGLASAPVGMRLFSMARRSGYTAMTGGLGQLRERTEPERTAIKIAAKDVWVRAAAPTPIAAEAPHEERERPRAPVLEVTSPRVLNDLFWMGRYGERAESAVRLLIPIHDYHQDYRYRPWMEGAAAMPVLMATLARATGTVAPAVEDSNTVAAQPAAETRAGYDYLAALTIDRDLPGSLAFAIDRYGNAARAVRDQLSSDTWMILGAVDRAIAEFRGTGGAQETALTSVHSLTLAALLALSGIGGESLVRDAGWYVMDIGKRIERGIGLTELLSALTRTYAPEVEQVVTEAVLRAAESLVSYRRRYHESVRASAVAALLLFDAENPRSLVYQLDRMAVDFKRLPGDTGTSRAQRVLADARRMLGRIDPTELDITDDTGHRGEFAELLDGVALRLRKISESFETTKLSAPVGMQPLWGSTRVVA